MVYGYKSVRVKVLKNLVVSKNTLCKNKKDLGLVLAHLNQLII